ncbi:MAG: ATP-binding protein, partial [Proteobacteria bacterium]|nr:ATP-binding protein [Pseudomonadota bacterium]
MKQLEEILLQGYESKDLDYKGPCQWDEKDKKACCEIVKDILAMANTLGGYIVIGVKENDKGFECQGLSVEQAKSFETSRLNRFLQNYADPPINALLK